jgi:hypothetical protein
VKDWKKRSNGYDVHFQAAREAAPEISAAHGVIVHVPHHDPLLFSATDRRRYKKQHFHYFTNYLNFSYFRKWPTSKQE